MSTSVDIAVAGVGPEDVLRADTPSVVVVRTERGWSVLSPGRAEDVADLVEGMTLADLVAEELGAPVEPDRTARRAARGSGAPEPEVDPRDARIAALERTVAQLEHALAARVSTERAIGVLAERLGTSPRATFELLRGNARASGRPVPELARQVLDELAARPAPAAPTGGGSVPRPPAPREPAAGDERPARSRTRTRRGAAAESRS
ncbi:ANTAR domain-containing protein [Geodermatophilus marinus]|uniref:ANTAR domain-containing protein n=1 Tax=Geodermatophilus sp. LHW52908 TaxID=2303986 RepID=UPI000E3DB18F|nr:GAF and ANTAR domain-containing protein [Geodermatophilus sp. LHW52908]RFU21824.1 ANTAR domain-containing protein [Geodermatophilus sp. LHW52908]